MENSDEILNELKEVASRPDLFSRKDPYAPPAGYFQHLPETILLNLQNPAASEKSEADAQKRSSEEIPGATPLLFSRKMLRYGIAASTIGILVLVGWWYFLFPSLQKNGTIAVQDKELIQDMQPISEAEITSYIESGAAPALYGSTAAPAEVKDEDIRLMLADLSEWELRNYLEDEGAAN